MPHSRSETFLVIADAISWPGTLGPMRGAERFGIREVDRSRLATRRGVLPAPPWQSRGHVRSLRDPSAP
jgi:hypothetical protein